MHGIDVLAHARRRDPATGRYRLMFDTNSNGRAEPELGRRSAGPLPAWATARGCDLNRFDFRTTQLSGASTKPGERGDAVDLA